MLTEIELSKMNPAAYNPRVTLTEDMPEYKALLASIEEFGEVEPIVWNKRTGNIVGGHQRYNVLKALGEKKAFVSVVDLNDKEEKALNVALNKVSGDWDEAKLKEVLESLDVENINLTGFNMDEIALLLEDDGGFGDISDDALENASEYNEDAGQYGMSYVITLHFENADAAKEWAAKEGIELKLKPGTTTTVIRMEAEKE